MFCVTCGKELKDGENFCSNCGSKVIKSEDNNREELTSKNKIESDNSFNYSISKNEKLVSKVSFSWLIGSFLLFTFVSVYADTNYGEGDRNFVMIMGIISFIEGIFWNAFAQRANKNGRDIIDAGFLSIMFILIGVAIVAGFLFGICTSDDVQGNNLIIITILVGIVFIMYGLVKYIGRKEAIKK